MGTFVLVPGAWLGGWCWRRVTGRLRDAGHEVYTPTLTGLGERVHLASAEGGLETHVRDVVNVLEFEDLTGVILVGHSYAGLVAGSVADRVPGRVERIVYLAANLPRDGESLLDSWSPAGRAWLADEARAHGDGWRWPLPDDLGAMATGLGEEDLRWLRARATPHPLKTFADPLHLGGSGATARIPRAYVRCTLDGSRPPEDIAGPGWAVREIATGHWPMISAPAELVSVLLDLATGSG